MQTFLLGERMLLLYVDTQIPNQYFYLFGTLLLGVFWLIIFLSRRDLRTQMLKISFLISLFGFTEHFWYYGTYWTPVWILKLPYLNVGIEDFLLCFFYGGIAAALYEFVFKARLRKDTRYKYAEREKIMVFTLIAALSTVYLGEHILAIGIIFSTGWAIIAGGLVLLFFRKDLLRPALINFCLMLLVVLVWQGTTRLLFPNMYHDFWNTTHLSGIYVGGVLLEEYFWHASMAFGIGPLFEVAFGYADK